MQRRVQGWEQDSMNLRDFRGIERGIGRPPELGGVFCARDRDDICRRPPALGRFGEDGGRDRGGRDDVGGGEGKGGGAFALRLAPGPSSANRNYRRRDRRG